MRHALNFITVHHVDSVIEAALDFSHCHAEQTVSAAAEPPVLPVPPVKRQRRKPGIRQ